MSFLNWLHWSPLIWHSFLLFEWKVIMKDDWIYRLRDYCLIFLYYLLWCVITMLMLTEVFPSWPAHIWTSLGVQPLASKSLNDKKKKWGHTFQMFPWIRLWYTILLTVCKNKKLCQRGINVSDGFIFLVFWEFCYMNNKTNHRYVQICTFHRLYCFNISMKCVWSHLHYTFMASILLSLC